MEREEELLEKAVARLNSKLLGLVLGLLFGIGLFLVTIILVLKGGPAGPHGEPIVGPHLGLLSQFFPGYRVTFLGSLIGFGYGAVVGFVVGSVLGAVYNKIAGA